MNGSLLHTIRMISWPSCLCVITGLFSGAEANGAGVVAPQVVKEVYLANKAACSHGMCRYRIAMGSAKTEEDVLSGRYTDDLPYSSIEYTVFYDGNAFVVKTPLIKEDIESGVEHGRPLFTPMNIAKKGRYAIDHDGVVTVAMVHSPENYTLNVRYHPFNLAADSEFSDPASFIENAEKGYYDIKLKDHVVRNGVDCVLLEVRGELTSHDHDCYLDPKRGYLPLVTEVLTKGTTEVWSRVFLQDVREEDGAYFPMQSTQIFYETPPGRHPYLEFREMKVLELDLSYQPTAKDMSLQLPKYTQFTTGTNRNTAKTLFGEESDRFVDVSVNDIEDIYHTLLGVAKHREKLAKKQADRNEYVKSGRTRNWRYLLLSINGAFAILLAGLFYWKRRRARPEDPQL